VCFDPQAETESEHQLGINLRAPRENSGDLSGLGRRQLWSYLDPEDLSVQVPVAGWVWPD